MKPNECYAYFAVKDVDLDPAAITRQLGVAPSDSWKRGDLTPTRRERQFGCWELRSRLPSISELEEHILDVLMQMDANPGAFKEVGERHGGLMQLVGYFHEIGVGLQLTRDVVKRIAAFGLEIDQDFYYLYSESRECTE